VKPSTLLALLVFAALAVGVGYVSSRKEERGISRTSLAQVDTGAIDRLEISGPSPVNLHKDGDRWRTDKNKDADPDAVKAVLDSIPKIQSSDFATRAPERYADFGVDDAKGTHVVAKAGAKVAADFIVGKASGNRTPFRIGDSVYWVTQVGARVFVKDAATWLDKKMFTDKLEAVSRVEVHLRGQKPYALAKKETDWAFEDASVVPAGFRYDKGVASTVVSQLDSARAKDVLDADPGVATTKLDADADAWLFSVKDSSGVEMKRELKLGAAQADGSVYARVAGREDVFTVPEFLAKALRKPPTDLRDLTMMSLDSTKVEELTLVADKMKVVFEKKGGAWKIASSSPPAPKGFEFDPAAVDRRVSALLSSRAIKLAEISPADAGLTKPTATLTAKLGKQTVTLAFGKDTKDGAMDLVYAKGNADGATYLVTKWIKTNLMGGIETFKKQPAPSGAPNFDPSALSNLPPEVRAQLMQQLAQRQRQGPPSVVQANAPPPPAPPPK
jgi:hypothetical protein